MIPEDEPDAIPAHELEQIINRHDDLAVRYDDLFSFIYDLRLADFQISPPQFIAIYKLIFALTGNGESHLDFQNLKTYLAPLVCSSPEEQTTFYDYFDHWLKTHKPPELLNEPAPPDQPGNVNAPTDKQPGEEPDDIKWWKRPTFITFFLTIGLITTALIVLYCQTSNTKTFSGTVRDKTTGQPISGAEIVAGEEKYTSNQDGSFSFKYKIPSSPLPLTVKYTGYHTANSQIAPDAEEKPNEFNLTKITETPPPPPPSVTPEISNTTPTVTITPTPTPAPVEQTIPPLTFYQRYYLFILLAALLLPFVIYGLWNLWWLWRRRQLERWRESNQPDLKQLTLKREEDFLYRSPAFRRIIQELRRHRRVQTNTLDIGYTVEATVREGGLFTPVFGRRQISPEYLVLIDRLGFRDQKSQLEEKILDRFKKEGIFFECFYFNGDPRLCRQKDTHRKTENPKYFHIQELSMHYPEHRLLIFSDGAGMVDEFSNRPHRWVDLLAQWETRALLTPNSASEYHEWILEKDTEMPVLPAREADLKMLLEIIRTGDIPKARAFENKKDYPPTFLEEFEQWWLRRVNPHRKLVIEKDSGEMSDKTEKLCLELRYYLGKDGYHLLCACAVYPELSGDLTFYLAHHFIEPDKREATLESLVCLPWFRHGFLPDWLRERFLSELPFEKETEIRETIEQLLINYFKHPQEGFSLEIAESKKTAEENLWHRLRRLFTNWRERKFFHDIVKTEPENSPLKDYVFLRFVSGNKLAVSLPRKLSRFLQTQSSKHLGFLQHFYEAFSNLVKAAGKLWQKVYRMDIALNGMSQRNAIIGTAFVSALAVFMLLQVPPGYPSVNPDDSQDEQFNSPEDDIFSKTTNAFATPTPLPAVSPVVNTPPKAPVSILRSLSPANTQTGCEPGKCCTNLTAADGYMIQNIRILDFASNQGSSRILKEYPILPNYTNAKTIYSSQIASQIIEDAKPILSANGLNNVRSYCAQILSPSQCPSGGKCINFYIYAYSSETIPTLTTPQITPAEILSVVVVFEDKETKEELSGQVTFTDNKDAGNTETFNIKVGDSILSLNPGSYTVTSEVEGYITDIQTFDLSGSDANVSLFIELKKDDGTPTIPDGTITPIPTVTPTPAPLSLVSATVTFKTGTDSKGKNDDALIEIRWFDKEVLGNFVGGKGEEWSDGSVITKTINFNRPISLQECNGSAGKFTIAFSKTNLENDWDISFSVAGQLSNGTRVSLLDRTKEYELSQKYPNAVETFPCPRLPSAK